VTGLTPFQVEVSRLFFSLPQSSGFLLAGGSALLASGLTHRPTQDIDLFAAAGNVDVLDAAQCFEESARDRGWDCARIQSGQTFVRFRVSGTDVVVVDLAIDAPAGLPTVSTTAGPTFAPEELAGRKLAALFDRAEARDFADVFVLARRFDRSLLERRAAEVDLGFDRVVLATMMRTLSRFTDSEIPADAEDVPALRAFFAAWADDLDG